jgi:hypothetical protein
MDTWHYLTKICTLKDLEDTDKLNKWGDMGWELVAMEKLGELSDTRLEWVLVFKQLQNAEIGKSLRK